jgi:hypothetical protein
MIRTRVLRELAVASASSPGRSNKLSAASGLVRAGAFLYVAADDENHIGVFPAQGEADGWLVRVFDGELPLPHKLRKASKRDPEALTRLPAFAGFPSGALLAWGSGSRSSRRSGALLALDAEGALVGAAASIDLGPLYEALESRFPELNIEGAVVSGADIVLLQRGSRKGPENACIRLPLGDLFSPSGRELRAPDREALTVQTVELGVVAGVALAFTDAAALPDGRIVFTAVAENAKDSYEDGPCAGSAIGLIDVGGTVEWMRLLEGGPKVEGVHAEVHGDAIHLLMVTDADDASVPAQLLAAQVDLRP